MLQMGAGWGCPDPRGATGWGCRCPRGPGATGWCHSGVPSPCPRPVCPLAARPQTPGRTPRCAAWRPRAPRAPTPCATAPCGPTCSTCAWCCPTGACCTPPAPAATPGTRGGGHGGGAGNQAGGLSNAPVQEKRSRLRPDLALRGLRGHPGLPDAGDVAAAPAARGRGRCCLLLPQRAGGRGLHRAGAAGGSARGAHRWVQQGQDGEGTGTGRGW